MGCNRWGRAKFFDRKTGNSDALTVKMLTYQVMPFNN
jgi:hypothetical protein